MNVTSLVERLVEQVTEIGYMLPDLDAPEPWKVGAAKRALPFMLRDAMATLDRPVEDAPSGFYESLQMVVDSLDHALQIVTEAVEGGPSRGFAANESQVLLGCLGFIREHATTPVDIDAEPPAPEPIKAARGPRIPAKYRSKPISKQLAAKLLGKPQADSGVRWLNLCIADETITCEEQTRQSFVFDIRQFPSATHAKLLPPNSR